MKTSLKLFAVAIGLGALATSCKTDCPQCPPPSKCPTIDPTIRGNNTKLKIALATSLKEEVAQLKTIQRFKFKNEVKLANLPVLLAKASEAEITNIDNDADLLNSIFNSLMLAESKATALDVEIVMSDAPVEDGIFVFGLKSATARDLTLQMFKETDFELVASSKLSLTPGSNYKALNVKDFEAGSYILKMQDPEDKSELMRRLVIATTPQ